MLYDGLGFETGRQSDRRENNLVRDLERNFFPEAFLFFARTGCFSYPLTTCSPGACLVFFFCTGTLFGKLPPRHPASVPGEILVKHSFAVTREAHFGKPAGEDTAVALWGQGGISVCRLLSAVARLEGRKEGGNKRNTLESPNPELGKYFPKT